MYASDADSKVGLNRGELKPQDPCDQGYHCQWGPGLEILPKADDDPLSLAGVRNNQIGHRSYESEVAAMQKSTMICSHSSSSWSRV
jgi:hypothetical protein